MIETSKVRTFFTDTDLSYRHTIHLSLLSIPSTCQKELRYLCNDRPNIRPQKPQYQIFDRLFSNFYFCYI